MTTEEKLASLQESIKKAKELGIARTQNEFAELIGCSPVTLSSALANHARFLTDSIVFRAKRAVAQATPTGDITHSPNSNTGTQTGVPASVVNNLTPANIRHGRVEYIRAKTHKAYSILIQPEAAAIIEQFASDLSVFYPSRTYSNYRDYLKRLNRDLRVFCSLIHIPTVTTNWLRHS